MNHMRLYCRLSPLIALVLCRLTAASAQAVRTNPGNLIAEIIIPEAANGAFGKATKRKSTQPYISGLDIARMMGHAEVKMQFVYTVGMDENEGIATDRLGKELGSLENELGKIGQFLSAANNQVN
ncbi:MAG TPA: hypothetical protein VE422_48205 [Terriglobia bacterium]|nr:hypothetical protein [Terriglobia bacterium]